MVITVCCFVYVLYCILPTYFHKIKHKLGSNDKGKNIFLTFDDGPDTQYTNELLDVLKEHNVSATFFVVAKSAQQNKNIINRMVAEGHSIGLHSLEHKSAMLKGISYTKNDLIESLKIMKSLNVPITYYRPPWGHMNLATLFLIKKNNLKLVLWDRMADDWKQNKTHYDIKRTLVDETKRGDIICLHDARGSVGAPKRTILALKEAIPQLKCDYNFELLDRIYQ